MNIHQVPAEPDSDSMEDLLSPPASNLQQPIH